MLIMCLPWALGRVWEENVHNVDNTDRPTMVSINVRKVSSLPYYRGL